MAKLKTPLLSLGARGGLAKALSFVRRRGQDIVEKMPQPEDAKSLAQLSWRHMYLKAVALWNALSASDKLDWESLARSHHMTGYAYFLSQALKPNPGLYLPLQGGTMAGDIDMAKYKIEKLPTPTDDQEAANKKYVDDNVPPAGAQLFIAETEVFNGNSPAAWTDLDLSGTIGANYALVLLKLKATPNLRFAFRKNGDADEFYSATIPADASIGLACFFNRDHDEHIVSWVATDNAGIIEWRAHGAVACTIDVMAYIK